MKRKILITLLAVCTICFLVGCGGASSSENDSVDNNKVEHDNEDNNNVEDENDLNSGELSIDALDDYEETSKDDFVYKTYNNETYIAQYIGDDEVVVVPDEIDGTPVIEISNTAFRNNETLKAIKIGDNVKRIGDYAFANCISLEYVKFGDSVEVVGESAFVGNGNVKEFYLNEGILTVESLAFCEAEEPIIIPKSVTEIEDAAFSQPVKVYAGSYAEQWLTEYLADYGGEFAYEVIE